MDAGLVGRALFVNGPSSTDAPTAEAAASGASDVAPDRRLIAAGPARFSRWLWTAEV